MALVGWPNIREGRLDYRVAVPGLLSFLVHGDWSQPVAALDQFPEEDRPPVVIPFAAYHAMVYVWGALDVESAAAGEMPQPLQALRRAERVDAPVGDVGLLAHDLAAAHR